MCCDLVIYLSTHFQFETCPLFPAFFFSPKVYNFFFLIFSCYLYFLISYIFLINSLHIFILKSFLDF